MFNWLRNRRHRRIRSETSPAAWESILEGKVPYFRLLPPEDRAELLGHVHVLLAEKHFEGCAGFLITEEVRVTIAAHAACLLLHRNADYFPRLKTILVYPNVFYVHDDYPDEDGIVSGEAGEHAGQSWDLGVVVLAWEEVEYASKPASGGYNVVLHEFAHQLDIEDGSMDGTPFLENTTTHGHWAEALQLAYDDLLHDLRRNRPTVIDEYGATDEAEFFAVAIEAFFGTPVKLRRKHPELYKVFKAYFQQDPAHLAENKR